MTTQFAFTCDRCSTEKRGALQAEVKAPQDWRELTAGRANHLLCPDCLQDFDAFMRGARIEYVAVERDKTVPA